MRKPNAALRPLLAALALSACGAEPAPDAELPVSTNQEAPSLSLEALVKKYDIKEIEPGRYLAEDMVLTGEQVVEHYGAPRGALIVSRFNGARNIWSAARRGDLTYCVSDNFGANKARIVAGMERATRAWSREAGAGVTFRYTPEADGRCERLSTAARISVSFNASLSPRLYAIAAIGPEGVAGDERGYIHVGPLGVNLGDSTSGVDLKATLAHELGHVLGFYHEQDHPAALPSRCGDGRFDANHEVLTAYDPASIMHYIGTQDARCPGLSYMWLSQNDKVGARSVYPGGAVSENACFHRFYGRGAGAVPDTCSGESSNGICYPRCNPGFYGAGPVCWQQCPAGYVDDGAFCRRPFPLHIFAKSSYGRGAGIPLSCRPGLQADAGLCYPPCTAGFNGVGPVCHESC